MDKAAISFIQEFVIGFGFLNGLWVLIGFDPEVEIIRAFADIVKEITPSPSCSVMFWAMPIVATCASLVGYYLLGSWLGILSVALAFLGGVFISSDAGVFLLVAGIILGFFAPHMRGSE